MSFQIDNCCDCGSQPPPCPACAGTPLIGSTIVGVWAPSGNGYEEFAFTAQAGRYMLVYCGGAFGFTVLMEPIPGFSAFYSAWESLVLFYGAHAWRDPQWLPPFGVIALAYGVSGRFIDSNFGNAGTINPTSVPYLGLHWLGDNPPLSDMMFGSQDPNAPFDYNQHGGSGTDPGSQGGHYYGIGDSADQSGANDAAGRLKAAMSVTTTCPTYGMFYSDGTFPVTMQFTAPLYKGDAWPTVPSDPPPPAPNFMINQSSAGAPTFALLKLVPTFTAKGSCGFYESNGQCVLRLIFSNDSDFFWSGNASVSGPGVTVISGNSQAWSAGPHSTVHADFTITFGSKNITATLNLFDSHGSIESLTYDLTPTLLKITATSQGSSFVDPNRNRIQLQFGNSNGLPFDNVQAQISTTGGITGVFDPFTGAAISTRLSAGVGIQGCGAPSLDFVFDISTAISKPASVTLTVNWFDNNALASQPLTVLVVPLIWT